MRRIINVVSWPLHTLATHLHRLVHRRCRCCFRNWPRFRRVVLNRKSYSLAVAFVVIAIGERLVNHHVLHPLFGDGVVAFGLSPIIRIVADAMKVEV